MRVKTKQPIQKLVLVLGFLLLILLVPCRAQVTASYNNTACQKNYKNPVFEPDLADPTVVKASDGYFYAYGTENRWSSGVHRVIPIARSKDLINWVYVGDAFAKKPNWKQAGGIWAPCIVYRNNTYYLYYSFSTWGDSNPGIGLATSSCPTGPFTDQGKVFDSESVGVTNSIDPFFITVGEGRGQRRYLFWGSFRGIYGIEVADDMKTLIGEKFQIAGNAFEAVCIYPKNGKFYFFGSNGSCCEGKDSKYRVSVAVAGDIKGPYKRKDGVSILNDGTEGSLFLKGDANTGWVGPGHNGEIFTDESGRDFILYHAIDYSNPLLPNGATRRPLMLDQVHWDKDGWPYIENTTPGFSYKAAPHITTYTAEDKSHK